jgi:hypothetical protein
LAFGWVVADSGYGRDPKLRAFCHRKKLAYVFAVPVDLPLVDVRGTASRPDVVLAATRDTDWERRSCGHGAKGQRYWEDTPGWSVQMLKEPAVSPSHPVRPWCQTVAQRPVMPSSGCLRERGRDFGRADRGVGQDTPETGNQ